MRGFLHRADSAEGNGLAFVEPVPKRWLPFDNRVVFPGLPSGQACPVVGSGTIRETAGAQHTQKRAAAQQSVSVMDAEGKEGIGI